MALTLSRFSDALNRLLGARGRGAVDVPLAITATLPLQSGGEADIPFTRGELRYSDHRVAAAVVGNFSWVNLDNPLAAGKLIVIERMILDAGLGGAAAGFHAGVHSALGSGTTSTTPLETRGAGAGLIGLRSTGRLDMGSAAAVTESQVHIVTPANQSALFDVGAVLQPGTAWRVWNELVNQAVHVTLIWTERTFALDELR